MFSDISRGYNFRENLIPIDNHIKALWDAISEMGRVPILPQLAESGYYTSEELGRLGEQYIFCLFENQGIRKNPADRRKPSPDFRIKIDDHSYLLETKIVRYIHKTIYQILYELGRREKRYSLYTKLEQLVTDYVITLSPEFVHFLDERKLKNKIRKRLLPRLRFPITTVVSQKFECPFQDYTITIKPQPPQKPVLWPPENGVSLGSIISRKRRQIGSSDFLFVILVGKTSKRRIQDLLYPGYTHPERKVVKSIWDLEYESNSGTKRKIKNKLKAIFFLLPYFKKCFLACSPIKRYQTVILKLQNHVQKTGFKTQIIVP